MRAGSDGGVVWVVGACLLLLLISGCATARGGDEVPGSDEVFRPTEVEVEVVGFDPSRVFVYTFADGARATLEGLATVEVRISPPGRGYRVEQSPDLINWVEAEPLTRVRVGAGADSETWRMEFQVLGDPETDDLSRQFFRVVY